MLRRSALPRCLLRRSAPPAQPPAQARSLALSAGAPGLSSDLDAALSGDAGARAVKRGLYRACASREEYARFMLANYFYHSALERAFASQPAGSAIAQVWDKFPALRGAPRRLGRDLRAAGVDATSAAPLPAWASSVAGVESASSAELLGHFYARYLHLPGVLDAGPLLRASQAVQLALSLPEGQPEFLGCPAEEDRDAYFSRVRAAVDAEGRRMAPQERAGVVDGAISAVSLGAEACSGRPRLFLGAAAGRAKVAGGWLLRRLGAAGRSRGGGGALGGEGGQVHLLPTARRDVPAHA